MKDKTVIYPEYRKYNNNKSFFKIISPKKFEEIKLLGSKISIHFFEAKILPDRNYISDLTFNYSEHWIICTKSEYEELKRTI